MDPDDRPHELHTFMGLEVVLSAAPDAVHEVSPEDTLQHSIVRVATVLRDSQYGTLVVAWGSGAVISQTEILSVRHNVINDSPSVRATPERVFVATGARLISHTGPEKIVQKQGAALVLQFDDLESATSFLTECGFTVVDQWRDCGMPRNCADPLTNGSTWNLDCPLILRWSPPCRVEPLQLNKHLSVGDPVRGFGFPGDKTHCVVETRDTLATRPHVLHSSAGRITAVGPVVDQFATFALDASSTKGFSGGPVIAEDCGIAGVIVGSGTVVEPRWAALLQRDADFLWRFVEGGGRLPEEFIAVREYSPKPVARWKPFLLAKLEFPHALYGAGTLHDYLKLPTLVQQAQLQDISDSLSLFLATVEPVKTEPNPYVLSPQRLATGLNMLMKFLAQGVVAVEYIPDHNLALHLASMKWPNVPPIP
eukprot:TRINITY_DN69564_c0_g1_i1.p1 TRINITY_DN69564_c0_g1~~TRINITY_DN69564_c0_g1_i1.p1  ORF type:complete len:423 (+),score=43.73 TRINITY_DN69564_c0_g1_i1:46-1314(+)